MLVSAATDPETTERTAMAHMVTPQKRLPDEIFSQPWDQLSPDALMELVEVVGEELARSHNPEVILIGTVSGNPVTLLTKALDVPPKYRHFKVVYLSAEATIHVCSADKLIATIDAATWPIVFCKPTEMFMRMMYTSLVLRVPVHDLIDDHARGKAVCLLNARYELFDWTAAQNRCARDGIHKA